MSDKRFEAMLKAVAKKNHTTPERVRWEMQLAMDKAMASPDPIVQAGWVRIPRKGEKPTLEEFVSYMASLTAKPLS